MTDPLGHDASVPAFLRQQGPRSSQTRPPDRTVPAPSAPETPARPSPREPPLGPSVPADPPFEASSSTPGQCSPVVVHTALASLDLGGELSPLDRPCALPSPPVLDRLLSVRVLEPAQRIALATALLPHAGETRTAMALMDLLSAASVDDTHPCLLLGCVVDDGQLLEDLYFELAGVPESEAGKLDGEAGQSFQAALRLPSTAREAMQTLLYEAPRHAPLVDVLVSRLAARDESPPPLVYETLSAFGPLAWKAVRARLQLPSRLAGASHLLPVARALGPFARPLLPDLFNRFSWSQHSPAEHLNWFQSICAAGPPASMVLEGGAELLVRRLAEAPPQHPDATLRDDCQIRARALLDLAGV